MRILWSSNSVFSHTGYGVQSKLFLPRIRDLGHEVAMLAFYGLESGVLNWEGIKLYPRATHPYGQDAIRGTAEFVDADIVISLMDAWVCEPQRYPAIRHCPYFPIDMEPLPPPVKAVVERAFAPIVMSRFGERMMHEAGLDCQYVPHAVDTSVYTPMDTQEARLKIDPTGSLKDRFVVGMVAANKGNAPSRKAFPEQIKAFAEFRRTHTDALLYLHTNAGPQHGGVNLWEYVKHCGLTIGKDVVFCDQFHNHLGFPDEYMVATYNAMDVLLNVSMGEGFGCCLIEAQACGVPVIVGDWTAMSELVYHDPEGSSGYLVGKEDAVEYPSPMMNHKAVQWLPKVGAIEFGLRHMYRNHGGEWQRNMARNLALAYDVNTVTEKYWRPALERIGEQVDGHKAMLAATEPEKVEVAS